MRASKLVGLFVIALVVAPLAFFTMTAVSNQVQYGEPLPTWQAKTLDAYHDRFGNFETRPEFVGTEEEFILGGVNRACGLMTQDPDIPRTFNRLVDFGYSSDQSTFFIAAGTYYRCTELRYLMEQ